MFIDTQVVRQFLLCEIQCVQAAKKYRLLSCFVVWGERQCPLQQGSWARFGDAFRQLVQATAR